MIIYQNTIRLNVVEINQHQKAHSLSKTWRNRREDEIKPEMFVYDNTHQKKTVLEIWPTAV